MAAESLLEDRNVQSHELPEINISTDPTARTSDHDSEKGRSQEAVQKDEAEAESREKLEIQGVQLYVLIAAIMLGAFAMGMNGTMLGVALPAITAEFHTVDDIGWYGTAYLLAK